MSDFILHHYPLSPYSEKIRAMLAYTGIDWLSVIHKEMPPRPFLEPLAGNYGRIPVAQIGADIFCDSRTIAAEIARISNKPELDIANASSEEVAFVEKVQGKIFFACVLGGGSLKLGRKVLSSMSLWDIGRFFIDRIKMGSSATTDHMIKPQQAKKIIFEHLEEMESFIKDDFLFGDQPSIGDFCAYHSLWFVRDAGECSFINGYPKVCAWMDRIKSLGSSKVKQISGDEALAIAADSEPRELVACAEAGKKLAIGPSDYRQIKTDGKLVFEDDKICIIARDYKRAVTQDSGQGTVHVHFPKEGYQIK